MKLSLVILTSNEIQGLKAIYERIPLGAVEEVIAVDWASKDGTKEFLKEHGIRVIEQTEKGRGNAFRLAFANTIGDALIFFSPDGNEDPTDIPKFREYLENGASMVIANRMSEGGRNEEDAQLLKWRKWANQSFTLIANVVWNRSGYVHDTINGYRAITRDGWQKMAPDGEGYTIEYQTSIRAFQRGLKITEFPTYEGSRVDERIGSPSLKTGIVFLKLLTRELRASVLAIGEGAH